MQMRIIIHDLFDFKMAVDAEDRIDESTGENALEIEETEDVSEEEAAVDSGNEEGDPDEEEDEDEEEEDEEDEEEPVDPQDDLNDACSNSTVCKPLLKEFETCEERVSSRTKTEETCLPEYLDFIKCRDKCVSRDLFAKLK